MELKAIEIQGVRTPLSPRPPRPVLARAQIELDAHLALVHFGYIEQSGHAKPLLEITVVFGVVS